jgi:hypothetical protein
LKIWVIPTFLPKMPNLMADYPLPKLKKITRYRL